MADALVAVEERMVVDQRETQRCRLLHQRGIQVDTAERCPGLSDGRLQSAQIPDPRGTPCRLEKSPVQLDDPASARYASARRRYSPRFLQDPLGRHLKSSPAFASRSAIAAWPSSGLRSRRSAQGGAAQPGREIDRASWSYGRVRLLVGQPARAAWPAGRSACVGQTRSHGP
jgi:hypothetical protein